MTLQDFFYLSVSIAAVVMIIVGFAILLTVMYVRKRLSMVFDKVDKLTTTTGKMAMEMKDFVHTTAERIVAMEKVFLTAQGLEKVAGFIGNAFKNRKKRADARKKTKSEGDWEE